ncbi:hypothetical protein, partial [Enterococcus faecium]|uniref:hypothetical protein n=1 Tax=Enterococcus faecium TaxID=1352 RepID=UPI0030C85D4F
GVCVRLPSATTSRLPPCLSLTVPTAKPVVDFHHQVFTHAGRTSQQLETIILFQAVFLLNHAILSDFMHFQP